MKHHVLSLTLYQFHSVKSQFNSLIVWPLGVAVGALDAAALQGKASKIPPSGREGENAPRK